MNEETQDAETGDQESSVVTEESTENANEETREDSTESEAEFRLSITSEIEDIGPCRKRVRITIPQEDLSHYFSQETTELAKSANVPGFRVGHVPGKLIEKRFREELSDQVKQKILINSLEQVAEENDLDPINEPEIDVENIEIPEEGDFEYEFEVEVRPDFDLPDYRGLKIERPVRETTDEDVAAQKKRFFSQYAQLESYEEPAGTDDFLSLSAEFCHGEKTLAKISEFSVQIKPVLRFQDAELNNFDELMKGVTIGDEKEAELTVSLESENIEMRGEKVQAVFKVLNVERMSLPESTSEILQRMGIETEEELDKEIRSSLERQVTFQQRQAARTQVLEKITESADWDLPEDLVLRQVENALRREILEMQQAGFTSAQISSRENEIRQQAVSTTRQALKEHFVLDKIATEENIEVGSQDVESEIRMMALQRGESPRRVRAQLEKSGQDENLFAQLREQKAVDFILSRAEFQDVPIDPPEENRVAAVTQSICGIEFQGSSAKADKKSEGS